MNDAETVSTIEVWTLCFTLILVRTSSFVSFSPVFAGKFVPHVVKVGLSLALATMWFGAYEHGLQGQFIGDAASIGWVGFAVAVGREIVFGALLGYTFGLLLLPARVAGAYIGQEMGLSLASVADPSTESSSTVMSQIFETLSIIIFFSFNVHHVLLAALHASFIERPIGEGLVRIPADQLALRVSQSHEWGLLLVSPLAICLFVALIILTLLMKVAPQFNLFSMGLGLRLAVGLAAGVFFFPEIVSLMSHVYAGATTIVQGLGV